MRTSSSLSLSFLVIGFAGQLGAGSLPFSTFLAAGNSVQQVATDAKGNIYLLGQTPDSPIAGNGQDVFVAKLGPAAAAFEWTVYLGGSSAETAAALAVDSAGSVYVTGTTVSPDFPVLPATGGATLPSDPSRPLPFAAKIDSTGDVVYSVLFSAGVSAYPAAIAVDSRGEAFVSGLPRDAPLAATAGAYNNPWNPAPPFVIKLDATGTKVLFSAVGVGGSAIQLDSAGNIYVAGTTVFQAYPTTAGAYQTTFTPSYSCSGLCQIGFANGQQYVTKLSSDGSQLIYSTFITGDRGASNTGLAVDSTGSVWVTGYTLSDDFPYTVATTSASRPGTFTTRMDQTGSKVLLSLRQGGFNQIVNGSVHVAPTLALDPEGNVVVAGSFTAPPTGPTLPLGIPFPPIPPAGGLPQECLPQPNFNGFGFEYSSDLPLSGAYAMRLSGQDGSILGSRILPGSNLGQVSVAVDAEGNIYIAGRTELPDVPLTAGVVFDSAVSERTAGGIFLARVDLSPSPLGCVTDAPTSALVGPVAPGQLITLYGTGLGPDQPVVGIRGGIAGVPTSLGGVSVTFDGQPAPLLYVSSNQINVQVPYSVRQSATTSMQVSFLGSVKGSRIFPVIPLNPTLFVTSHVNGQADPYICNGVGLTNIFFLALALNRDGSVNSCSNPAKAGSEITLFVNGLGTYAGTQITGSLIADPKPVYPFFQSPAAAFVNGLATAIDSFTDEPGAISGLSQVQVHLPTAGISQGLDYVGLSVNGVSAGPFRAGTSQGTVPASVAVFVSP